MKGLVRRAGRFAASEPGVLVALVLAVSGIWLFIELLDEILEGETDAADTWLMRLLRQTDEPYQHIGPQWLVEAARDITALGSAAVLILVVAVTCGFLLLRGKRGAMWLVLAATILGQIISSTLKVLIARERPTLVPHLAEVGTASFPSGHAMLSAVVYLTLAALLMRILIRKREKIFVLGIAMLLTGLVGLSRVFLGVHYPTDVLAGWSIGAAWALLSWAAARLLQMQGTLRS